MCGIAGAATLRAGARASAERVSRMTDALAHRGPDAFGYWTSPSGRALLGHRRLSIIDLSTGQQPMISVDGRRAITFNGEIYNYVELRQELVAAGETFRTESDTEILLRLYELEGERCVDKLRGMFVFAIWDDDAETLFVARDRLGKKPFFYTVWEDCLYFASSLEALQQGVDRPWTIDLHALDAFLTLGYVPAPACIFQDVYKLQAGARLVLDRQGLRTSRYWNLDSAVHPFEGTYEEAVDRLDDLVNTAVKIRLRSDVPLGVFLSGGVDSTLITALAARHASERLRTFTVGFDVAQFDEAGYAAEVARTLNTEHIALHGRPDLVDLLPKLVRHFGEPCADSSALPIWILARETRRHVTVALGGDGGDEAFGGYPWYRTAALLRRMGAIVPKSMAAAGSRVLDPLSEGRRQVGRISRGLGLLSDHDAARFARMRSIVDPPEIRRLYKGPLAAVRANGHPQPSHQLESIYRETEGSPLQRMRRVDIETYLADCLMPKVDVATMAHGLEARAPLLDQEVVEFAMSLPDPWLVTRRGGKEILKTLATRYLPASFFERPKQGFDVPLQVWFGGAMRTTLDRLVTSERLLDTGWFDSRGLRLLAEDHLRGTRDQTNRLYNLLVLEEWLGQR
jgi:asparagine synthase (glutamine-hydrolysing)